MASPPSRPSSSAIERASARARPLLALAVAGCATAGPPPETARTLTVAPGVALERAGEALGREGFAVRADAEAGGPVLLGERSGPVPGWARCRSATVGRPFSDSGQTVLVPPAASRSTARLAARSADGGSVLTVAVATAGLYRDPFRGDPFEIPCQSTGALERALLDAAGPPA